LEPLRSTRNLSQTPFHIFEALAHLFLLGTQPQQFVTCLG
jgi:hypothetical protein